VRNKLSVQKLLFACYAYFAGMIAEECDDYTAMATRVLEAFREWLAKATKHPAVLAAPLGKPLSGSYSSGLPRAGPRRG
jgi:hypothetical protein